MSSRALSLESRLKSLPSGFSCVVQLTQLYFYSSPIFFSPGHEPSFSGALRETGFDGDADRRRAQDALGGLGVVFTYGADTPLFAEPKQFLESGGVELGGFYEPATPTSPNQLPPSSSSSTTRQKRECTSVPSQRTCGPTRCSLVRMRE
ncbi:hypothetical protein V8E53_002200 [Lactarius tabidus]